jgi:hypothetical protein
MSGVRLEGAKISVGEELTYVINTLVYLRKLLQHSTLRLYIILQEILQTSGRTTQREFSKAERQPIFPDGVFFPYSRT